MWVHLTLKCSEFQFAHLERHFIFDFFYTIPSFDKPIDERNRNHNCKCPEPPCLPERSGNGKCERGRSFIPFTLLVGAFHEEGVFSGRKVDIIAKSFLATKFPFMIETIKPVSITVLRPCNIIDACVKKTYVV